MLLIKPQLLKLLQPPSWLFDTCFKRHAETFDTSQHPQYRFKTPEIMIALMLSVFCPNTGDHHFDMFRSSKHLRHSLFVATMGL
mmetsp:Transcript_16181/g.21459  ORF Transcript_16181/g.21459 Transcript_16181/m.21459 type:complete len:84 (-) Transcript_16181:2823-3074(-)